AQDRDAVMHPLSVEHDMLIAALLERIGGEDTVEDLRFLQAQDVGLLLVDQPLDECRPRPYRVDVPRGNLQSLGHYVRLAPPWPLRTEKAPAPGAWSEAPPSVRHPTDPAPP